MPDIAREAITLVSGVGVLRQASRVVLRFDVIIAFSFWLWWVGLVLEV